MRRRAFSLVETILGLALLGIILAVAFRAFEVGARSWRGSDLRGDMVLGTRLLITDLERETQRSTYASLSVEPGVCAFASASDADGQFAFNAQGEPQWRQYVLYYLDGQHRVCRREVEQLPPSPPQPLAPLSPWKQQGHQLVRWVEEFEVTGRAGNQIDYRVFCREPRGREIVRFSVQGTCLFRNP